MGRERWLVLAAALAAVAAGAACKRDRESPPPPRSQAQLPPPLAGKSFYRIDAGPRTRCTAGAPCEARIVLTALGAYHVNQKYPFKFVSDPVPGVAVDGTGTFALDDARTGMLTLRFRVERGGPARFAGTFKLSVCTDEQCEIEEPKIEFELPVS
jgi:hypothetical protein